MLGLDLIDRRLLVELDIDSRQPVSALAKKVRLSKQAVKKRLEKLEHEKIILGYYAVIDIFRLQRLSARLWIKLQGSYNEDEIIKFCLKMPDAGWVLKTDGAYDMAMVFWSKDLKDFDNALKELNFNFGAFLKEVDISFIVRAHHISHRYLTKEKTLHELVMEQKFSRSEIDAVDEKILQVLAKNSRTSLVEMAKQLGISDKAARYRIKNLEKNKFILGYMIMLDYSKIGYTWHKVFLRLQNLSEEKYSRLISYLKSKTNVMFVTEAIGVSDLEFEAMLQTPKEFHELMREIRQKFPEIIKEFSWITIFKIEKVYYAPQA
ncbi:MAG: Lrp/AsnC family transcriptional regulator [Candidatus ainarchaeum sp.]|nr:Lrp/AsnC family transcriptional regulator [Candidatus ainarchaeum sp.]